MKVEAVDDDRGGQHGKRKTSGVREDKRPEEGEKVAEFEDRSEG